MKGSGGTEGGFFLFGIGFLLSAIAAWLLLDSVIAQTGPGFISGMLRGRQGVGGGHRFGNTTSMGIIFLPFLISVVALFYDASKKWAWFLLYVGVAIVAIEILSHLRFTMSMKTSHLMLILGTFAAGVGLMLKSYRDTGTTIEQMTKEQLGQPTGSSGASAAATDGTDSSKEVTPKESRS